MSAITRYRLLGFALLFSVLGIAHAGHSGKVYDTVFATAAEARDHCPNPGTGLAVITAKADLALSVAMAAPRQSNPSTPGPCTWD